LCADACKNLAWSRRGSMCGALRRKDIFASCFRALVECLSFCPNWFVPNVAAPGMLPGNVRETPNSAEHFRYYALRAAKVPGEQISYQFGHKRPTARGEARTT